MYMVTSLSCEVESPWSKCGISISPSTRYKSTKQKTTDCHGTGKHKGPHLGRQDRNKICGQKDMQDKKLEEWQTGCGVEGKVLMRIEMMGIWGDAGRGRYLANICMWVGKGAEEGWEDMLQVSFDNCRRARGGQLAQELCRHLSTPPLGHNTRCV
jgi:hypothetical protein